MMEAKTTSSDRLDTRSPCGLPRIRPRAAQHAIATSSRVGTWSFSRHIAVRVGMVGGVVVILFPDFDFPSELDDDMARTWWL